MGIKLVTQIPSEPQLLCHFYSREILVYGRFALLFIICSLGDDDDGFFSPAVIVMPASRAFPLLASAVNANDVRLSEEVFDFSVIHPALDWAVAMG